MEFQVFLTPRARRDLAEIGRYISKDNPSAAARFCGELAEYAYGLRMFPKKGPRLQSRLGVRKLVFREYEIIYRLEETEGKVEILRFWHAAQDRRHLRLREVPAPYDVPVGLP